MLFVRVFKTEIFEIIILSLKRNFLKHASIFRGFDDFLAVTIHSNTIHLHIRHVCLCFLNYCFWVFFPNVFDLSTNVWLTIRELENKSKTLNVVWLLLCVHDLKTHGNGLIFRLLFPHRYDPSVYSLPVLFALLTFHKCARSRVRNTRNWCRVPVFRAHNGKPPIDRTTTKKQRLFAVYVLHKHRRYRRSGSGYCDRDLLSIYILFICI